MGKQSVRRYGAKKRSFKRRRRNGTISAVQRTGRSRSSALMGLPSGITMPKHTTMRYSENVSITSTLGGLGSYVFRANSIFDPNFTGTGHQPMAHDTYETLFNHYMVVGAKLTVVCSSDTGQSKPFVMGSYLGDGSTVPYTNASEFIEAKKGSWAVGQGRQAEPLVSVSKFSARQFFNCQDTKDNRKNLGASFGSNPNEDAYFVIWYQNEDASTDTLQFRVVIDYVVQFFEPKDLAQS